MFPLINWRVSTAVFFRKCLVWRKLLTVFFLLKVFSFCLFVFAFSCTFFSSSSRNCNYVIMSLCSRKSGCSHVTMAGTSFMASAMDKCLIHGGDVFMFCLNARCNRPICRQCYKDHNKHNTVLPEEYTEMMQKDQKEEERTRQEVESLLRDEFPSLFMTCERKRGQTKTKYEEILESIEAARKLAEMYFEQMKDVVEQKRKSALEEIQQLFENLAKERRKAEFHSLQQQKPKAKKRNARSRSISDTTAEVERIRSVMNELPRETCVFLSRKNLAGVGQLIGAQDSLPLVNSDVDVGKFLASHAKASVVSDLLRFALVLAALANTENYFCTAGIDLRLQDQKDDWDRFPTRIENALALKPCEKVFSHKPVLHCQTAPPPSAHQHWAFSQ